MGNNTVTVHFDANADGWLKDAYEGDGHVYPTALHRARIVGRILAGRDAPLTVADLGCGGGNLSIALAEQGHRVSGVDQSTKMLKIANAAKDSLAAEIRGNVDFVASGIEGCGLEKGGFDVVTAMGVIGYQESDDDLFRTAQSLLKPGGLFILSCRNRLFNMASPSPNTIREIENGTAAALLDEMNTYCQPVPPVDGAALVEQLSRLTEHLSEIMDQHASVPAAGESTPTPVLEPRQHTPKEIDKAAARLGFQPRAVYGVHPHLIDPRANRLLPPGVFNAVSESLCALEHLPISLLWSSVFISVLEKQD